MVWGCPGWLTWRVCPKPPLGMVGNLPISDRNFGAYSIKGHHFSYRVLAPHHQTGLSLRLFFATPKMMKIIGVTPQVPPYFSSASLVVWGGHQESAPKMTQNTNLSLVDCQPHSHTFRCVEELRIVTLTQVHQMVHNLVVQHVDLNMVRPCKAESTRRLTYLCRWI